MSRGLFHLSFPVDDLTAARHFYVDVLGCPIGARDDDRAFDFVFFGHHLIAHLVTGAEAETNRNASAGRRSAVRHFGVVVDAATWDATIRRLQAHGATFLFGPVRRHDRTPIAESLALVVDPAGNAVEFKTFDDPDTVFVVGDRSINAARPDTT